MRIIIKGRIPSKKNSRITVRKTGMTFPSAKYTAWHKDAMLQLKEAGVPQTNVKFVEEMHLTFYAPDKRKFDSTNKAESIMDLLVDYNFIEDDNVYICPDIRLTFAGVDRENPRCEIVIPD